MMPTVRRPPASQELREVAGNGLIDRRALLQSGAALAVDAWSKVLGQPITADILVKVAMPNRDGFIPLHPNKH